MQLKYPLYPKTFENNEDLGLANVDDDASREISTLLCDHGHRTTKTSP